MSYADLRADAWLGKVTKSAGLGGDQLDFGNTIQGTPLALKHLDQDAMEESQCVQSRRLGLSWLSACDLLSALCSYTLISLARLIWDGTPHPSGPAMPGKRSWSGNSTNETLPSSFSGIWFLLRQHEYPIQT